MMRPQELFSLFSPVTRLKGVGQQMGQTLSRLLGYKEGVPSVRDLLFHLPVGLLDRRYTCALSHAPEGVVASFVVDIVQHVPPPPGSRHRRRPYRVYCENETGTLTLVFFNLKSDYLEKLMPVGSKRVISGRTERFDGLLQMSHPDIIAPANELENVLRVEPVYPLTQALTSRRLQQFIQQVLEKLPVLPEWQPKVLRDKYTLPSWGEALVAAHHPETPEDLQASALPRMRLAADEILANQLRLALIRQRSKQLAGRNLPPKGTLINAVMKGLPFKLTKNQQSVLEEIHADMGSGQRMARLLQGDVGSGKTVVALLSMLAANEHGAQAALMAPTDLIARQHHKTLSQWCEAAGISVALLTGSIKGAARKKVLAEIADGSAHIVVGTHALFQEHVQFADLAMVVVDEQHRFGVNQRLALVAKGEHPHILHMTATPIPRSLQMTLYGDMECSILREKPAGRKAIATRTISVRRYQELLEGLKRALDAGNKVYWICPLIDDSFRLETGKLFTTEEDLAAAESRYTEFAAMFGERVGLVHGRMKSDERTKTVHEFAQGKIDLLVATTVVEVGVDVPDATIMIIEQAERFGLSQLHQLRGRVGRSDKASSCVLLYREPLSEEAKQRLAIVRDSEDGFAIADADMKLRGAGELLGTRQSGLPDFAFTDLAAHSELLADARKEAAHILDSDPELDAPDHAPLHLLLHLFGFEQALPEDETAVATATSA